VTNDRRDGRTRFTPGTPDASRCVLVVDDNADVRELVVAILRREGHRVHEAHDGGDALDVIVALAAEKDAPRLILLDLMMPVMDGPTFIARLRARGVETPVVVLTASGRSAVNGASEVVAKPFDPDRLCALVKQYAD
jgi:two-component system response regulator MprA